MASISEQFHTLVHFETELWNDVERRLRSIDGAVSLGRNQILELAAAEGTPTRVQDIADELRITVGAASRLTDRLETDGLISRAPHPTDRRGSQILLTEAGTEALRITTPAIDVALTEILGAEGADRLRTIAGLIRAIPSPADTTDQETSR